jgi:CxxC-x17-CxxC domain-containing protein
MKNFQRGGSKFAAKNPRGFRKDGPRGGARGGFGASRGRSFGKPQFGSGQMFKAVCSSCGEECMVPFEPVDGRPVYCNNCFKKNEGGFEGRGERGGRSFEGRSERPAYRPSGFRKDFAPREASAGGAGKDYSKELAEINGKLDHILTVLADLELDSDDDKE